MEPLVVLGLLATSVLIAFAAAKGTLAVILHLMSGKGLPFSFRS